MSHDFEGGCASTRTRPGSETCASLPDVAFFAAVATLWNVRDIPRYPPARWLGRALIVAGVLIQRYGAAPPEGAVR